MIWVRNTKISLFGIVLFCALRFSSARPKDLESFYKVWKPLELVRGLRSLSVDPFDVFRALEAVKKLDSEEALDVMHDLDVRPITVYDALEDLGVHPFDAYYALKAWLTDPLLHQPGDHYHRVNASGDPTHPYLHVLYKKSNEGGSDDEYKAVYLTSKEVEEELKEIEKEYKEACQEEKLRMNEFINKAKKIHAAFDDPTKVFEDFFGKRHFREWTNIFPDAFKHLKEIYKNPLGFGLKKDKTVWNDTTKQDKMYQYLQKGRDYINKVRQQWDSESICQQGDAFSKYNDPKRYDTLQDETHTENLNPPPGGDKVKTRIYHTKVFYDKLKNIYVECKQIQEHVKAEKGVSQKTKTCVRQFDPKSFESYRQQLQNERLKEEQKKREQLQKVDQQPQQQEQQQHQQQQEQQQQQQHQQPQPNQQEQPQPEQPQQPRPDQQQQQQPDQQQQQEQLQPDQPQRQQQPHPQPWQQQPLPDQPQQQQQQPHPQPWQQPYQHYQPQPPYQPQQHYYPHQFYPYQYQQYQYPQQPHNPEYNSPYHPHHFNQQQPQPHQHSHQENQPQNQDQHPPHQTEPNPHAGG